MSANPLNINLHFSRKSGLYRYSFNGQETEGDITGANTHTSAEFWMYDTRLGRRWEIDPEVDLFPDYSSYSVNFNSPLLFKDVDGDCPICAFVDYAFQVTNNLLEGKSGRDAFYGDIDWLGVGANLIPGGRGLLKTTKFLLDFAEWTPNGKFKRKELSDVVISKSASKMAKEFSQSLQKMSSNKTLKGAENRLISHQNRSQKLQTKLSKNPDSKRLKSKLEKSKVKAQNAQELFDATKQLNDKFGNLNKTTWKGMEKTMEKTFEKGLKEATKPRMIVCGTF